MAKKFTIEEARDIAQKIGLDFAKNNFPIEEFCAGLSVELEHGNANAQTNVTNDDLLVTGKIAWAHLNEISDYYTRLAKMENDAEK